MLKGQDIVTVLLLSVLTGKQTYLEMGHTLGLSASEAHASVRRLTEARLLNPEDRRVLHRPLCNFLIHGVPHAFPAHSREITQGIATAWAAPVLRDKVAALGTLPPVWPHPAGEVRGVAVQPLYPSVPQVALANPDLYDLLALVDTLRLGSGVEWRLAAEEIFKRMTAFAST